MVLVLCMSRQTRRMMIRSGIRRRFKCWFLLPVVLEKHLKSCGSHHRLLVDFWGESSMDWQLLMMVFSMDGCCDEGLCLKWLMSISTATPWILKLQLARRSLYKSSFIQHVIVSNDISPIVHCCDVCWSLDKPRLGVVVDCTDLHKILD